MAATEKNGKLRLYDTTLRDGAQGEGVWFSLENKLDYIRAMQEWGAPYIEAGWPGANPRDDELFAALRAEGAFRRPGRIVAFGSTCKAGTRAEESPLLKSLIASGAETITIFGKSWELHVREVLRADEAENLRLIRSSVEFLTRSGLEVFFDAEHFFDGWKENRDFVWRVLEAALAGGARGVVLCDTNGGALPAEVERGVRETLTAFAPPVLGIHTHNDGGLAVANTLAAVAAGATQLHCCWNGYGERCGNANLGTLVSLLQLKMGYELISPEQAERLSYMSRYAAELANAFFDERQPFLGRSAFAHKAGTHADAVLKDSRTFEHIDPALVGNTRRILISEQSGRAGLWERMRRLRPDIGKDHPCVEEAMRRIKAKENEGYQFEAAEGSLDLLLLRVLGAETEPFTLEDYHVWSDPARGELDSVAVVKVKVGGESLHLAAEGDGPVNALDRALRRTLAAFFPALERSELIDYKVRVLDGSRGTGAQVRVLAETRFGLAKWGTVGVSANILRASAGALLDALYVVILRDQGSLCC
ncbi:MAG: citramalate synthase [Gracilibacteraceae bacterium]|jgi:2-isopropylmalate synthase|nr:citramalate synthase [Gracilibacteraceae bacterium]